jgi:hypothetical protein
MLTLLRVATTCVLAGSMALTAACGTAPPSPPAGTHGTPAGPTPGASGPVESGLGQIAIEDLPPLEPDPATLTAVCDPQPDQLDPDAGEGSLFCLDGIMLGLRAVRTTTDAIVRRAYLVRPDCPVPCSGAPLDTANVVVWTDLGTFVVRVDARAEAVSIPQLTVTDPWPRPAQFTSPGVDREELPGAPVAVAERDPYPYCGRADAGTAQEPLRCFRASVLLGQPAEVIQHVAGIEGQVIDVLRFDGAGAVTRLEWADGRWVRQRGGIVLGPGEGSLDFVPWAGGEVIR